MSPAKEMKTEKDRAAGPAALLAVPAVFIQAWEPPDGLSRALDQGTIFRSLCLPFWKGGDRT